MAESSHNRGEIIRHCFQVIQMLQRKGGVTIESLATEMNVHKRTVYRYIQEVSVVFTVWETREQPKRFRLLED